MNGTYSNSPLISIIIATYQAEYYLKDCLESIRNQSFTNFELIIIDGGSTDDTLNIISQNQDLISYWKSEPDKGIYDALNKGIDQAAGQWLLFLGADDRLLPGFSEMAMELSHSSTLYYGDCISSENEVLGGEFSAYKLAKMNCCQQALFYPARVFSKYRFNTRFPVFADYALNIQCWGDRSIIKKYVHIAVAKYDMNGFSSKASDDLFRKEKPGLVRKYLNLAVYTRYRIRKYRESKKPGSNFF